MRIRSTKPEFWRSDRIAAVSWDARLVLKALESFVDDNGVGKDDIELIVGDLFMRDLVREPSRTLARVSEAISELHQAGLVWRYRTDDTDLLYIAFWESVQRIDKPQSGRFRRPDGTLDYKESMIRESVANVRESSRGLAPGTGEQGNRGTGDLSCAPADADDATEGHSDPTSIDDRFEEFWIAYDKPTGKVKARQKWRRAIKKPGVDADLLIDAASHYIANQRATGKHRAFTKDPTTWLNGEHWTDDLAALVPVAADTRVPNAPVEQPPDGLTDDQMREWYAGQRRSAR